MIQPGSWFLSRQMHELIENLAFNLPIRLRNDPAVRVEGLTLAIVGWHLRPEPIPFLWELLWTPSAQRIGGRMMINRLQVAKHFRSFPSGLWLQSWGDIGTTFDDKLRQLENTTGFTHDDVERYIVGCVVQRSRETQTVGDACLATQLDPRDEEGHVQFSYYPSLQSDVPNSLFSGWLLTPTLISAPTLATTRGSSYSACNRYVEGGFYDTKSGISVRTRLPLQHISHGGPEVIGYGTATRTPPP